MVWHIKECKPDIQSEYIRNTLLYIYICVYLTSIKTWKWRMQRLNYLCHCCVYNMYNLTQLQNKIVYLYISYFSIRTKGIEFNYFNLKFVQCVQVVQFVKFVRFVWEKQASVVYLTLSLLRWWFSSKCPYESHQRSWSLCKLYVILTTNNYLFLWMG